MRHLIFLITFFSIITIQNIQAQAKGDVVKKNQIKNIEALKMKAYKLENGKTYKAHKIENVSKYLSILDLNIFTPDEIEALDPGEECENSTRTCPEGYECKNARFLVEDCGWFGWLFGCDSYFLVRTYKECIPVNALSN